MTTQKYITENNKVVMFNCGEADHYPNKVWECMTNSFTQSGSELVFLKGFSGSFSTKYLKHI